MLLFAAAAAAGIAGTGPLERERVRGGAIEVEHSKFKRRSVTTVLRVRLMEPPAGLVRIRINRDYLRRFTIESIMPEPVSSAASQSIVTYGFDAVPGQAAVIEFHMRALDSTVGRISGSVGTDTGGDVSFTEFVWP